MPARHNRAAIDAALDAAAAAAGVPVGSCERVSHRPHVAVGARLVLKAIPDRGSAITESLRRWNRVAAEANVPTPRLLDAGVHGGVEWQVLERCRGHEGDQGGNYGLRAGGLARALRAIHTLDCHRDDTETTVADVDVASDEFSWLRTVSVTLVDLLARTVAAVCAGLPSVPAHGDVTTAANALFEEGELVALIDPNHRWRFAPAAFDITYAATAAVRSGDDPDALLDAYGPLPDGVGELWQPLLVRHWAAATLLGRVEEAGRLRRHMSPHWTRALTV